MAAHLTRIEKGRGPILGSYQPVCQCGWTGAEFWSRHLAERAGVAHQLGAAAPAVTVPPPSPASGSVNVW
ncbi:MAG: hypothetical protein JSS68_12325 [Actinobacteria bacterium]|nr:hypothetical protein [Actinomycetota bacterium]